MKKSKIEKKSKKEEKQVQNHNNYRNVNKSYYQTCTQYTLNGYSLF